MKKIGRPKDSGRDDSAALGQIAKLRVDDPALKLMTAIKRALPNYSDADLRRLQVKWKAQGESLLETERRRRVPRPDTSGSTRVANWPGTSVYFDALAHEVRMREAAAGFSCMQTASEAFAKTVGAQTMMEAYREHDRVQKMIDQADKLDKLVRRAIYGW